MSNILHSQAPSTVLAHLAGNLRRYRQSQDLSQGALAEAAGVSRRMIAAIEGGDANASIATLDKLAAALGIRFADLVRAERADHTKIDEIAWQGESPQSKAVLLATVPAETEAELWTWSLAPGDGYTGTAFPGHEIIYVLDGKLTIETDTGHRDVLAGNFHAQSLAEQRLYTNRGTTLVRFIRAITQ